MMKVMPYDPSHEEVYNAFIMKTEPKTEVFSAEPTETDRQETFWNRNNTINLTNLLTLLTILTLLNPTLPHDDVRYPWELENSM